MNDKERILYTLVQRIYMKAMYGDPGETQKWRDVQPGMLAGINPLQKGDLVIATTSPVANPFMVGYFEGKTENGGALIREIGSNRLCNYENEWFYRIDKSILGPEMLDGERYILYQQVEEAAKDIKGDSYVVMNFEMHDNTCTFTLRKWLRNKEMLDVELPLEKATGVEGIQEFLDSCV